MKATRMVKIPIQIEENRDIIREMMEISRKYGEAVDLRKIKKAIEEEYEE